MRQSIALLLLLSIFQTVHAQSETARRKGDKQYASGDYYAASRTYEMWLGKTDRKSGFTPYSVSPVPKTDKKGRAYLQSIYQLAESYRELRDYEHASLYYWEVSVEAGQEYPMAYYWYGICLRSTKQWEKAEKQFQVFLKRHKNKDKMYHQALNELNNCRFILAQLQSADTSLYQVARLAAPVNVQVADYAASWLNDTTLSFTSSRRDSMVANKPYYNRIYQATTTGTVTLIPVSAGRGLHNGAASFTADGQTVYFTGWEVDGNVKTTAIYKATKQDTGWTAPVKLPAPVNVKGANTMEPFITADNKYLLFSSDRKGGNGGYDLWYVMPGNNKYGKAIHLGDSINTAGDERSPFYHSGAGTLVFSSNGKTGMGGFDLYAANSDFTHWEMPQNLGYPVNSVKDDMYFFSDNDGGLLTRALISSDRASACCLEVFSLNRTYAVPVIQGEDPAPVKKEEPLPVKPPVIMSAAKIVEVYFDYNAAVLTADTREALENIVSVLKRTPEQQISISGFTDARGSNEYNYRLGLRRAEACAAYLRDAGVRTEQVKVVSYGKDMATTATGEARERKVVITFNK